METGARKVVLRRPVTTLVVLGGGVVGALGLARPNQPDPAPGDPQARQLEQRLRDDVMPLLAEFCMRCHGAEKSKGEVRFDGLASIGQIMAMASDLTVARELVATGEMPPDREPAPTEHQRLVMQQWLDDALAYYPPDGATDPGWFTIHRLNRAEYRLTMRDLLGVDPGKVDVSECLPPEDIGYGFDNMADVLAFSPLHLERYFEAGERALEAGLGPVVEIDAPARAVRLSERPENGADLSRGGFMMYSNGRVAGVYEVPVTGEYELIVSAWGTPGGAEHPRLSLRVDGREVARLEVEAKQASPGEYRVRTRLPAGRRTIAAHFTNDFYQPNVADRNLAVESIDVGGPVDMAGIERPAGYTMVFVATPGGGVSEEEAARAVLAGFARRAYRRPLGDEELGGLMALYQSGRDDGQSWERAVRLALTGVLVSPRFLFRFVENPLPDEPGYVYELSDHELAARLSYFLWSSMPDAELSALADAGGLRDEEVLRGQVRRMLADEKSHAFIEHFSGQWLQLRNLPDLQIDRERYPAYDDDLCRSMIAEATLLFEDVVRSGRSALDLIDSRETFVDARLARLYGLAGVVGEEFRRVTLPDGSPRGGILTTGAVLTLTSNPGRTSPVKRGLYVLEEILGAAPPPPPADVPPLEQSGAALGAGASLREQLEAHLTNPVCASCHRRMDPIGLAMENFNAIGQWRDDDGGVPIDACGELPGGVRFNGPWELKQVLLSRAGQFIENLTGKMLTYALGRGLEPFDRPTIARIADAVEGDGGRVTTMIEQIVLSEAFRTCRGRSREN
ncbi:MAG: DUF1592 domain-containing protein [Phycisphaerales bacterium]|nr:DUF1592 domain-containing protein [Phycisphaerales bacterium]